MEPKLDEPTPQKTMCAIAHQSDQNLNRSMPIKEDNNMATPDLAETGDKKNLFQNINIRLSKIDTHETKQVIEHTS